MTPVARRSAAGRAAPSPPVAVRGLPEDPQVRFAFTDRAHGNVSLAVGEPRPGARPGLVGMLGLPAEHGVFMQQVHGAGVARVGALDRGRGLNDHADGIGEVDALITFDTGVALVVLAADCVPVLLVDPGRGVAAVHAGRRGVAAGVIGNAVDALAQGEGGAERRRGAGRSIGEGGAERRRGAGRSNQGNRSALVAVVGPAIGGCCYEVPGDLANEVAAVVPAARATTRAGTPALDLPTAVAAQLADAGVGRVELQASCTQCNPDRWFSHRASTGSPYPDGRQAGIVCRLPAVPAPGSAGAGSLHSNSR